MPTCLPFNDLVISPQGDNDWFSEHTVRGGFDPGSCQCAPELKPCVLQKARLPIFSISDAGSLITWWWSTYGDMYIVEKTLLLVPRSTFYLKDSVSTIAIQLSIMIAQGTLVDASKNFTNKSRPTSCFSGACAIKMRMLEQADLECQALLFTGALFTAKAHC